MRTLKSVLIPTVALLMIVGLFCFSLQTPSSAVNPEQEAGTPVAPNSRRGIAPFERVAKKVQLGDVVSQLAGRGLAFYLPNYIPEGFELTAIWAKVWEGKMCFPILVAYSNSGDTGVASVELGIEIFPMAEIPFSVVDSSADRFMKIGDWTVYVNERAPVWWPEYSEKYGTKYAALLDLNIGGLNYSFRFSPILTLEEAISVVASMRQATASTP